MKIDDLDCANSTYLTIFQCSFDTYIDSGCNNTNSYDATVYCCKSINSLFSISYICYRCHKDLEQ